MTAWAVLGAVLDVGIFDLDLVFLRRKIFAIGIVIYQGVFVKNVGGRFYNRLVGSCSAGNKAEGKN
jgi:hypothetical protein